MDEKTEKNMPPEPETDEREKNAPAAEAAEKREPSDITPTAEQTENASSAENVEQAEKSAETEEPEEDKTTETETPEEKKDIEVKAPEGKKPTKTEAPEKKQPVAVEQPTAAETEAAKRSKRRWRRGLCIYAALWLVFAFLGCTAFYKYLYVYEQALPEHVMDSLMEETSTETWLGYVKTSIENAVGAFDDAQALYDEYESTLLAGKSFSYRRSSESTAKAPLFIVRCGGVDVCTVSLTEKPDSDLGFGKHLWLVGEIEPCEALANLRSTAVEITALASDSIYLNGVLLTDENLSESGIELEDMTEIERRFDTVPTLVRYRVDKMYGKITVTSADGTELSPSEDAGDGVTRYASALPRYSVTVSAPEDVTVTLCGTVLTADDAQSSDLGILSGLEEFTGESACNTVTWSFDDLYSVPDVRATDADGTELTPLAGKNGQILFFHANDASLQSAAESTVQSFFSRYIDYSSHMFLGNLEISREQVEDEESEITDDARASMKRYYRLLDSVYWTTDLYRYIQESTDAMMWASATSVDYDELTFTDFSFVGSKCFVCTIRYNADFTAYQWQEKLDYNMQNAYEVAFVCPNGGAWYAAAMDAVTE